VLHSFEEKQKPKIHVVNANDWPISSPNSRTRGYKIAPPPSSSEKRAVKTENVLNVAAVQRLSTKSISKFAWVLA